MDYVGSDLADREIVKLLFYGRSAVWHSLLPDTVKV